MATTMADASGRRGPDGGGVWCDDAAALALAHRRLTPGDRRRALSQPLLSSCGRFALSSDGEIYNGAALLSSLRAAGRAISSSCDLAAITEGAAVWGVEETLRRIEGELAGALWDREECRLYLFRDQLGAKPLYWTSAGDSFFFASELRALRASACFHPELDRDAVTAYLRGRAPPAPHSIYRGVQSLAPGTLLTLAPEGDPDIRLYWSLVEAVQQGLANQFEGSDEAAIDRFDKLLREATARRIGQAPAGVLLSAGFDSALLAGIARDLGNNPVSSFTVGFHQKAYNEAIFAGEIARHIGTDHHSLYLEPAQARDVIPDLPEMFDEPNGDISQIPSFLVSRLARVHVHTIVTGDGAAEAFGGGFGNWKAARINDRIEAVPLALRHVAKAGIRLLPPSAWNCLSRSLPASVRPSHPGDKLHKLASVLTSGPDELYRVLRSHWQDPHRVVIGGRDLPGLVGDPRVVSAIPDFFDRMHYFHAMRTTSDVVFAKADRVAAAAGIELRFPYADVRLVEFGWSLPQDLKRRGDTTKWILRQAAYRYVPRELLDRRKMAFDVPIGEWLRGPLRDWAEDLLDEKRLRREGVFEPRPIRARWHTHLKGERNWQGPLWVVLMFQAWKQRWLPAA